MYACMGVQQFVNITGPAIGQGMGSAAITLCTQVRVHTKCNVASTKMFQYLQTYGFKDYKRVGIILQRGMCVFRYETVL